MVGSLCQGVKPSSRNLRKPRRKLGERGCAMSFSGPESGTIRREPLSNSHELDSAYPKRLSRGNQGEQASPSDLRCKADWDHPWSSAPWAIPLENSIFSGWSKFRQALPRQIYRSFARHRYHTDNFTLPDARPQAPRSPIDRGESPRPDVCSSTPKTTLRGPRVSL